MKYSILFLLIGCFFFACSNNKKFSKTEWNQWVDFPVNIERDKMVDDLTANYLNKPLSYNEVVDLLGDPGKINKIDSTQFYISYMVYIEYEFLGIDETEIKFLNIYFDQDSIIKSTKRDAWKKSQ